MTTSRNSRTAPAPRRQGPPLRTWLAPVLAVVAVSSALAATYLGGSINASEHIQDFPIAIVNEDVGATLPSRQTIDAGADVAAGLLDGIDRDEYDIDELTLADAQEQMRDGELYGALVIPESLSADLVAYTQGALTPGEVTRPTVEVLTNPRMGTFTASIVSTLGRTAFATAGDSVGAQLLSLVAQTQASLGDSTPLSGTAALSLEHPLLIDVSEFNPLPDGTGSGLSAFYYALILVLAGFSGSLVANAFIDSRLGFVPFEFGPRHRMEAPSGYSRTRTLIAKWIVMVIVAFAVASAYVGISAALDMPIDHPWQLWAFSALAITGVAVAAQTINALLGNPGLMVNLFLMVVFAIPSSGGTVPLEATPGFFRWLGIFEPMHQIYAGTRSILYLDASWDAGLRQGVIACIIAIVLGLAAGLIGTRIYDTRGYTRGPATLSPTA